MVKIGSVDHEIIVLKLKKKKLTQAKYIARSPRSASLPSGLKNGQTCASIALLEDKMDSALEGGGFSPGALA